MGRNKCGHPRLLAADSSGWWFVWCRGRRLLEKKGWEEAQSQPYHALALVGAGAAGAALGAG